MVLSKNQFFGILFTLLFTPFLAYKIVWLYGSEKADGKMRFMGKTINGQMTSVYPVISFSTGADTVWFDGEGNNALQPGDKVPVRYQKKNKQDARINSFSGIWMDALIIAGIPAIMLLLIYLHREIFPAGTKFSIGKKPFFKVLRVHNFSIIFVLLCSTIAVGQNSKQKNGSPFPKSVHRILFLGNSITYKGDYITYIETYITTHFPNKRFEFINVGLPSETVSGLSEEGHANGEFPRPDLHERLLRVLSATKPDLVFANYGMNDGIYKPFDLARFALFKDGIKWLHEEVVRAGAKIIHLTPPIYDVARGGAIGYDAVLDTYANWLIDQRDSLAWNVIDLHFPMAEYQTQHQTGNKGFSLVADGIHPEALGHWIMAKQVLLYLDPNKELIAAEAFEPLLARQKNGQKIFDLINSRQQMMKDAWLSATQHKRPGMAAGLPLEEARLKYAEIEKQISSLLLPVN
jgi:lysophospholipase L1-like esterase